MITSSYFIYLLQICCLWSQCVQAAVNPPRWELNFTDEICFLFFALTCKEAVQPTQRLTFLSWWEIEVMFRSVRMWVTSFGTTKTVAPPKRLCNVHSLCNKRRTHRYVYAGICMHIIWTVSTHAPFVPDAPLQPRQGMRVLSIIANPISVKKSNRNITRKYSLQFSVESLLLKDLVLHCPYT